MDDLTNHIFFYPAGLPPWTGPALRVPVPLPTQLFTTCLCHQPENVVMTPSAHGCRYQSTRALRYCRLTPQGLAGVNPRTEKCGGPMSPISTVVGKWPESDLNDFCGPTSLVALSVRCRDSAPPCSCRRRRATGSPAHPPRCVHLVS